MNSNKKIVIAYHPGMYGGLLRWLLDRFSPDCKFKHINNPWDQHHRVHGVFEYNNKFTRADLNVKVPSDNSTDKIVINFNLSDLLFAERCTFYRGEGFEDDTGR